MGGTTRPDMDAGHGEMKNKKSSGSNVHCEKRKKMENKKGWSSPPFDFTKIKAFLICL